MDRRDGVHIPVLVDEVIRELAPMRGGVFVDCTVGLGGHARALLDQGADRLFAIDRDESALAIARARLAPFGDRVELVHADYRELPRLMQQRSIPAVAGILADLGVSSMQLEAEGRGFSFRRDEPLDMRMDPSQGPTAAGRLAVVSEGELADVIYQFGEERHARRIARAIVRAREERPVTTTGQLAQIVRRAVGRPGYARLDPATRTFQALRIWVNRELEGLDGFLHAAADLLAPSGRMAVVSFHSLEDRVVKHTWRAHPVLRVLTKRPIVAGENERRANPRARSAKLRAVERI